MERRRKDAAATRQAILQAARAAFTRAGYEGAGVREIAASIGVHPSLVNRYFGSKQRLFQEAVPATFDISALLSGEREALGPILADFLLRRDKPFDPTLAMVRSVGQPDAAGMLRDGLEARFVEPLAAWLGGGDARERAGLILALLAGVAIVRDVLEVKALSGEATVADRLAGLLSELIDG